MPSIDIEDDIIPANPSDTTVIHVNTESMINLYFMDIERPGVSSSVKRSQLGFHFIRLFGLSINISIYISKCF